MLMIETLMACKPAYMSSYQRMVHLAETYKYGPSIKQRDSNVLLRKLHRYFNSNIHCSFL